MILVNGLIQVNYYICMEKTIYDIFERLEEHD